MGLGVLNDKHLANPPGTVNITVKQSDHEFTNVNDETSHLKRQGNIILQPQPSDDINDPLNWSPALKNSIMIILAVGSAITVS
ncbi:MAG: hypothetical protein Q9227_002186 [Pyrenula ochraceoflavens]